MKERTKDPRAVEASGQHATVSQIFSSKKRRGAEHYYAGAGYPLNGVGIPMSLRLLHFSMKQASLNIGFDEEQVRFIWRTASLHYPLSEITKLLSETMESLGSGKGLTMYVFIRMNPRSIYREPVSSFVGQGAMAIRSLARLKSIRDQKLCQQERHYVIDDPDLEIKFTSRRHASWETFTNALAEKLAKDGLATDSIRDKVFTQDLGL